MAPLCALILVGCLVTEGAPNGLARMSVRRLGLRAVRGLPG